MVYTYLKYQGETPLNNQYTPPKNEGQEGQTGPVWGVGTSGNVKVNRG
jgi:hypothetical protein